MKKQGILNSRLSQVIASLGHTDRLVICDCGLPIPRQAEAVDLALVKGVPRFLDTVKVILGEMHVERAVIASEMQDASRPLYDELVRILGTIPVDRVLHEEFKRLSCENHNNTAFVRTGEATPFANVILISGVDFD